MKDHTILYLPCFDYHHHRQRPQHLLYGLSKCGFTVIYCNVTPGGPPMEEVEPNFFLCNDLAAFDTSQEVIMWLTHGPYLDVLSRYRIRLLVHDKADACVEEFEAFRQYVAPMVRRADLVFCASRAIHEEVTVLAGEGDKAFLVPNGVEFEFFSQARRVAYPEPPGIRDLPRPIIGFWGALTTWIDYDLVAATAEERPAWQFLFVGGKYHVPPPLEALPNVHFVGYRDYRDLPAYGHHFDAAIIPFQVREVTNAANPIKMWEYLAAGLPVVSTPITEARGFPPGTVMTAGDAAGFVRQLEEALELSREPESVALRLALAAENTWIGRAEFIAGKIRERLGG